MPKKQTTVDFDEIFLFAKKKFNMEWNTCCDVFYRGHELLQSPESHNKNVYLGDLEGNFKYIKDKTGKYYNENREKAAEILIAFMKKHKLKEMLVKND